VEVQTGPVPFLAAWRAEVAAIPGRAVTVTTAARPAAASAPTTT